MYIPAWATAQFISITNSQMVDLTEDRNIYKIKNDKERR
jgi:hypothetical protein